MELHHATVKQQAALPTPSPFLAMGNIGQGVGPRLASPFPVSTGHKGEGTGFSIASGKGSGPKGIRGGPAESLKVLGGKPQSLHQS